MDEIPEDVRDAIKSDALEFEKARIERAHQFAEKIAHQERAYAGDPNAKQYAAQTSGPQGALAGTYGVQSDVASNSDISIRAQCLRAALDSSQGVHDGAKLIEKAQMFYDFLTGKPRSPSNLSIVKSDV